jgi:uncharacterized protein YaiL (DUF2058 family)
VPRAGDSEYRFTADGAIRSLLVNEDLRRKLASGALVIARLDTAYELRRARPPTRCASAMPR